MISELATGSHCAARRNEAAPEKTAGFLRTPRLFRSFECCGAVSTCALTSPFFCGRPPFADPKVWFYRDGHSEAQKVQLAQRAAIGG